ncbi:MAG: flagellar type III secretion system pore protein FliP [Lachnospiraceae bacterium]|jgi:flagellar biosynthetic protein FliP|nr:flagellar type III secretion system pore protein FliP [Lachnospiraceae bacterium]
MKKLKKIYCSISLAFGTVTLLLALFLCFGQSAYATGANDQLTNERVQDTNTPNTERRDTSTDRTGLSFSLNNEEGNLSGNIRLLIGLTIISLAPAILIMLTSFTRIIVVLHFVRTAVGTQTVPPNQVMIGLALFLTLFIMNPVFSELNDTVVKPFDAGEISQEEALERAEQPIRRFMYKEMQRKDLKLFCDIANIDMTGMDLSEPETLDPIPMHVVIPSFIVSELRTAFIIGFLIYIPFIVIDMVVASVLMSMGMMMLPPTTISMPFKILLFVLADGWDLIIGNLVKTFY